MQERDYGTLTDGPQKGSQIFTLYDKGDKRQ